MPTNPHENGKFNMLNDQFSINIIIVDGCTYLWIGSINEL